MKALVQRVDNASVSVSGETVGSISKGYLILLGVGNGDTKKDCERLADKLSGLRIFSDENDKINLSIKDVSGELLVVSQFTLYADCRKGNRPGFTNSAPPAEAEELYEYFVKLCRERVAPKVETGVFGADMKISLINDGPFTVLLETKDGNMI